MTAQVGTGGRKSVGGKRRDEGRSLSPVLCLTECDSEDVIVE